MIAAREVERAHESLAAAAPGASREQLARALLAAAVRRAAHERGLAGERTRLRLLAHEPLVDASAVLSTLIGGETRLGPELIGALCEISIAERKQRGVFFTPAPLARQAVTAALERLGERSAVTICDPAVGGGAFLIEALRLLPGNKLDNARRALFGFDRSALAVEVAEACIWLEVADPSWDARELGEHLICADTLARPAGERFDLVIGNPPWVAYAGRAAQPLAREQRAGYARRFRAFSGYPTLHGMFVERAAELTPNGVLALLLPSPIADLAGYAPVRRALTRTHVVCEPLLELGQDAFEGVTQPCFVLMAAASPDACESDRSWRLAERQRSRVVADEIRPPAVLERVAARPSFPRELFGELGFQSAGPVSKTLLLRASEPDAEHTYPLLEGKDVGEFRQRAPRLFLKPDREILRAARCRLRSPEEYRRAAFVVRQTAAIPIAALHAGWPFRNSLLAGFEHPELSPGLVVALLNSSLYRALHLARHRDARQAAFPQVKVAHLRALPRPPEDAARFAELAELTRRATEGGMSPELRSELDRAVFELFDLGGDEREAIGTFLRQRGIGGGS